MNCTLCEKPIEYYTPEFNHLPIDDSHSADICSGCIDKFTKWQWRISANLFPTKTAKKMFKKNAT